MGGRSIVGRGLRRFVLGMWRRRECILFRRILRPLVAVVRLEQLTGSGVKLTRSRVFLARSLTCACAMAGMFAEAGIVYDYSNEMSIILIMLSDINSQKNK